MSQTVRHTSLASEITPLVTQQGQSVIGLWDQLSELLGRVAGPKGADLLTEPVAGRSGKIDWYGPAQPENARPAGCEALRAELTAIRRDVETALSANGVSDRDRNLAELLPLVFAVAHDSHIQDGPNGPVLVGWGHMEAGGRAKETDLTGRGTIPAPPPPPVPEATPPLGDEPVLEDITIAPPPAEPAPRRNWAGWRPWLLMFAALLGVALLLWLLSWLTLPIAPFLCRFPHILSWLLLLLAVGLILWALWPLLFGRAIRDIRRTKSIGARSGRMQIILAWGDRNDLDLHVLCPDGGRIGFGHTEWRGGRLDHDANARFNGAPPPTTRPVENIYWADAPLPGLYTILVDPFAMPERPSSSFRVTVRRDGVVVAQQSGVAVSGRRHVAICNVLVPS